jgi:hypothetical protein
MADGPAEIGAGWRVDWFARAISDSLSHFPKEIAEPIMRRYCADEAKVSSHYPWVAFAIAGYRRASLSRSDADLAPSEMQKVLQSISNKATELNELLEIVDRAGSAANRAGNVSKFKAYAAVDRKLIDVLSRKFGDVRTDDDWAEADDWRLALRLRQYEVRPTTIRDFAGTKKGYLRSDFADAWSRYLPQTLGYVEASASSCETRAAPCAPA